MFKGNKWDFLGHFVTVYKTWIYHNIPKAKEQWTSPGESRPKKAKMDLPAVKRMRLGWQWHNSHRLGRTITGQYYSELLDRFEKSFGKLATISFDLRKTYFSQVLVG